uniref:Reverse transcriptase N-terminal domain-containing protein n=1 Tax=Laurenciella marilzae TaxID=1413812 RepID=A0A1Z1M1J6_9FLOR|nr:hypothetical protein [Laurenciella marilzae]ARW59770.1 hypothetical protein [Laurenciella marilzae]
MLNLISNAIYSRKFFFERISLRILMLQKQIYIATKKNHIDYVNQLQKYLINSNEAKLMSIRDIMSRMIIKTTHYKNRTGFFNVKSNLKVIKILFERHLLLNQNLFIVNQRIRQDILYLSVLPVYNAKLRKNTLRNLTCYNSYKNYLVYISNNYLSRFKYRQHRDDFIQIIIDKLQPSAHVNMLITNILHECNIYLSFTVYNVDSQQCLRYKSNELKDFLIDSKNLVQLISNLLLLDNFWFFFRLYLKKYRTENTQKSTCKLVGDSLSAITDNRYVTISQKLKFFLYKKIYRNFKPIKIIKYKNKFTYNLIRLYLKHYKNLNDFLFLNLVQYCHKFINVFIYTYQRKIDYNSLIFMKSKKVFKFNYIINLHIYYYNILNFYAF